MIWKNTSKCHIDNVSLLSFDSKILVCPKMLISFDNYLNMRKYNNRIIGKLIGTKQVSEYVIKYRELSNI